MSKILNFLKHIVSDVLKLLLFVGSAGLAAGAVACGLAYLFGTIVHLFGVNLDKPTTSIGMGVVSLIAAMFFVGAIIYSILRDVYRYIRDTWRKS